MKTEREKRTMVPICDLCGQEVNLSEGILSISFKEVRAVQEAREAWHKEHSQLLTSSMDLLTFPDRACWVWHHCRCDPSSSSYEIDGSRFNTVGKALHWTLHLMGKTWFEFTNWRHTVGRFYPEYI